MAHRNPNTFYRKNEVYLDVVETVNVLISKDGTMLHNFESISRYLRDHYKGRRECEADCAVQAVF